LPCGAPPGGAVAVDVLDVRDPPVAEGLSEPPVQPAAAAATVIAMAALTTVRRGRRWTRGVETDMFREATRPAAARPTGAANNTGRTVGHRRTRPRRRSSFAVEGGASVF
jgi:hypothetical protein